MVKAVLFDMDGILFDSEGYYMGGTIEWMRQAGYTGTDQQIYTIIGTNMDVTYKMLYEMLDGKVPVEKIIQLNADYFKAHPLDYKSKMFKEIPDTLQRLKDMGLKMAVCSSSPVDVIDKGLEAMGIIDFFDYVIASDKVNEPKPAPDVYLTAAEYLGVKPEECIVYEDSMFGIQSGKNAKMYVVARRDERFGQDQSQADILIDNSSELVEIVERRQHGGDN